MARKSKGKFNMKGHSFPGIKGFKNTTLEDGRAESSAFQMKSPFQEEVLGDNTDYKIDTTDPTEGEEFSGGINKSYAQLENETGMQHLFRQWQLAKDAKKQKENNPSETLNEKITEYDDTTDAHKQYDVAPEDMIQDADGNWVPKEGAKSLTYGDTWSGGGWKDDATTESVGDSEETREEKLDKLNKIINEEDQNSEKAKEAARQKDIITGYSKANDKKVQDLIDKAQSGTSTSEGSSAIADIRKIYPEKSLEEILAMVKRGKI